MCDCCKSCTACAAATSDTRSGAAKGLQQPGMFPHSPERRRS